MARKGTVLVTGATGVQGSHVVRELATHGWRVRAMTHRPGSPRASALAGPRVTVVAADVRDPVALGAAMAGVDGVYLVEPWRVDGADGSRTAGVAVANAAAGAGVRHVVFSSMSGAGRPTGVAHLERKRAVELHLRNLGLPTTILRPVLVMERAIGFQGGTPMLGLLAAALSDPVPHPAPHPARHSMADPGPHPAPPGDRAVQVVAAADVATLARLALEQPERHVGLALDVAGDQLTVPEMVATYQAVTGRTPPGGGRPVAHIDGVLAGDVPPDLPSLLDWVREGGFRADVPSLRRRYPWLSSFACWLLGAVHA